MPKENCELLLRAKSLAVKRGLDDSKIECPLIKVCKGTRCHMFDPEGTLEENWQIAEDLERFENNNKDD